MKATEDSSQERVVRGSGTVHPGEDYAAFQSPLEWERARPAATAAWKRRAEAAEHRSSYPGMGV